MSILERCAVSVASSIVMTSLRVHVCTCTVHVLYVRVCVYFAVFHMCMCSSVVCRLHRARACSSVDVELHVDCLSLRRLSCFLAMRFCRKGLRFKVGSAFDTCTGKCIKCSCTMYTCMLHVCLVQYM